MSALFRRAIRQRPRLQISGGPQQADADPLILKIGVLKKQISFGGLHPSIGQFMQRAGLGVDFGLGCFQARLRQLIFQLRHLSRGLQLLGGALEFQRFLAHLIASCFGLLLRLEGFGLGRIGPGALAGVEQRDPYANADGGIVLLKSARREVLLVVIEVGKPRILSGKINRRQ